MRTLQVKRWRKRDKKLTWQPPMPYNLGEMESNFPMPSMQTKCDGCGRLWGNRFFICPNCAAWDDEKEE